MLYRISENMRGKCFRIEELALFSFRYVWQRYVEKMLGPAEGSVRF